MPEECTTSLTGRFTPVVDWGDISSDACGRSTAGLPVALEYAATVSNADTVLWQDEETDLLLTEDDGSPIVLA